jgi:uncharacterized membrane protein YfcA
VTADLSLQFLLLAPLIALLAYTVYGLTGFGSTVIAVPLLALIVPLKFAVPLMLLLDLVFGSWAGVRFRRHAQYREIGLLLPFTLVGMIAGVTLLVTLNERVLLGVLGVCVLGYGAYCLSQPMAGNRIGRAWAVPLGLVGGIFGAMFGTGGPVYVIYLAARIPDKSELRATMATVIFISGLLRLVLFGTTGLLQQNGLWLAWAMLLPVGVLGVWLGNRLHHALPAASILRMVYGLLVLAGVSLMLRVAAG